MHQLPTPYGYRDKAQTTFYRSRSLRQGQRSIQGHTMTLHTYNPNQCVYQVSTSYTLQCRVIARTRFYRSRSLWQGQRSNQGHTMTLHTYTPNQCVYQVSTSYTLRLPMYSPEKIL